MPGCRGAKAGVLPVCRVTSRFAAPTVARMRVGSPWHPFREPSGSEEARSVSTKRGNFGWRGMRVLTRAKILPTRLRRVCER